MITTQQDNHVHLITIDRHERRNALDVPNLVELRSAVETAVARGARSLVITGNGTCFSAGADLDNVYGDEFRTALYAALESIAASPIPVVAAVNGPAIGAGTQLAIACDLRVVSEAATFAVPTARNGLSVDPWTVRRLSLLAGGGPARAMLLGCSSLSAEEAMAHGLADRRGDLVTAREWATDIASMAPLTLSYSKLALTSLFEDDTADVRLDAAFDACWASEDLAEAGRARAEGRAPEFKGR